eukprot:3044169-Amphidinium_carterae.1
MALSSVQQPETNKCNPCPMKKGPYAHKELDSYTLIRAGGMWRLQDALETDAAKILKKKPHSRLKWLQKAIVQAAHKKIKVLLRVSEKDSTLPFQRSKQKQARSMLCPQADELDSERMFCG